MKELPNLSAAEIERLALLAEELSEAVSLVGKILRHGYFSVNPDDEEAGNNADQLARELGDVRYAVALMVAESDLVESYIRDAAETASHKKPKYLHRQAPGVLKHVQKRLRAADNERDEK